MGLIAKSCIQEINDRIDAIALVQDYVRLEKKGGRWWGRCPFHAGGNEKTPSFTVDPDKKMYKCFGCGKGGGIIGFFMEMDKLSYPEAVKMLARRLGVPLVYEDSTEVPEDTPDEKQKNDLFELYRRCAGTFNYFLTGKHEKPAAYEYIVSRGISEESIKQFNLGYAPDNNHWLFQFLEKKGYSQEFLNDSGLFSAHYPGLSFFTGRLMFPIVDRQGRTIAFGGRAMPGAVQKDGKEPPRYLNSRDSVIFRKGQTLFGIHLAMEEMRRSKTVYIAEGYMDVIAMHQAGLTNTVAPLGTAFTDEQAHLLSRWAERVILVFDSDTAGQDAAYKGILTCHKNGLFCSLVEPEKPEKGEAIAGQQTVKIKDPADILLNFGADILNKRMKCIINDFDYLISRSRSLFNTSLPEGKSAALKFLFPYLEVVSSEIERADCITAAADAFGTDRDAIQKDYDRGKKSGNKMAAAGPAGGTDKIRMNEELFLLILVAVHPVLYPQLRRSLEIREIEDPSAKEIFVALEECFINDETGIDALLSRIGSPELHDFIVRRGISAEFNADNGTGFDPARIFDDGLTRIKMKRMKTRSDGISAELKRAERDPGKFSQDVLDELLEEKMQIDAQLRRLEGK
ncbi:MAG: DNA primase [Treponema sp.]|nr:DNA primase [Treponema sp.]